MRSHSWVPPLHPLLHHSCYTTAPPPPAAACMLLGRACCWAVHEQRPPSPPAATLLRPLPRRPSSQACGSITREDVADLVCKALFSKKADNKVLSALDKGKMFSGPAAELAL